MISITESIFLKALPDEEVSDTYIFLTIFFRDLVFLILRLSEVCIQGYESITPAFPKSYKFKFALLFISHRLNIL